MNLLLTKYETYPEFIVVSFFIFAESFIVVLVVVVVGVFNVIVGLLLVVFLFVFFVLFCIFLFILYALSVELSLFKCEDFTLVLLIEFPESAAIAVLNPIINKDNDINKHIFRYLFDFNILPLFWTVYIQNIDVLIEFTYYFSKKINVLRIIFFIKFNDFFQKGISNACLPGTHTHTHYTMKYYSAIKRN